MTRFGSVLTPSFPLFLGITSSGRNPRVLPDRLLRTSRLASQDSSRPSHPPAAEAAPIIQWHLQGCPSKAQRAPHFPSVEAALPQTAPLWAGGRLLPAHSRPPGPSTTGSAVCFLRLDNQFSLRGRSQDAGKPNGHQLTQKPGTLLRDSTMGDKSFCTVYF